MPLASMAVGQVMCVAMLCLESACAPARLVGTVRSPWLTVWIRELQRCCGHCWLGFRVCCNSYIKREGGEVRKNVVKVRELLDGMT